MVCVRDLQVTQARTKLSFKALDGVLTMYEYGPDGANKGKVSITHSCTKLDSLMPDLIGVPRAVLEHVVLCHQEEANWPLQEGAKLKERFDQIFESDRYTKALTDIKKLRKDKAAEHKEADAKLALAESHVNQLKSLRRKAEQLDGQVKDVRQRVENEEQRIAMDRRTLDGTRKLQGKIAGLRRELDSVRARVAGNDEAQRGLDSDVRRLPAVEQKEVERLRALPRAEFDQHAANIDRSVSDLERKAAARSAELANMRLRDQALTRALMAVHQSGAERAAAHKAAATLEAEFVALCNRARTDAAGKMSADFGIRGAYTQMGASTCIDRVSATRNGLDSELTEARRVLGNAQQRCDRDLALATQALR